MKSRGSPLSTNRWLSENGLKELESLFGSIVYQPCEPILIADSDRKCRGASVGAGKLLGLPREKIIGKRIDDFSAPAFRSRMSRIWRALLEKRQQEGALHLVAQDGKTVELQFTAIGHVLPARHVLILRDKSSPVPSIGSRKTGEGQIPSWVGDYGLFLLDADGRIAAWYAGAERIYGYKEHEAIGEYVSLLYPPEDTVFVRLQEELRRATFENHFGNEGWNVRKDASRFWANAVTMALKAEDGQLQGFARVVRDFSDRHERDENLPDSDARLRPVPLVESTVAGIVSGEFDRIPEANDAFLKLVAYSREDLLTGRLRWPDLTPPEYLPLDEMAYEEGLRFGACAPFEKELIRKDGTRVPVLVVTAVLKLSPFRWITFVQDIRERARLESVEEDPEPETSPAEFQEIVGTSMALKRVLGQIQVVAPTDANVLVLGETGTGKELIARAIHRLSHRGDFPFITLNCAAIPTGLLESELFGYERGAFTGALAQKIGRFEMAHQGTLFLDEVGDIPLELQPKLLRALQEKAFERLGGTKMIPIDVRLVAATNRNLAQMMGDELFRSDLYYRLKVFPITAPSLRDHPEDIPLLARHFTKKFAAELNRPIEKIPPETIRALVNWPWPGNVRELENFIERSVILSPGPILRAPLAELREDAALGSDSTLAKMERDYILRVFRETKGVVSVAATRLGIPRTTLNAMMKKLGISRTDL